MATERTFDLDLKLPQTPPTENKELYEQLEYLYKAVKILATAYPAAETPATASSPGNPGQIVYDTSYLYICIATNTWRRIAHATW